MKQILLAVCLLGAWCSGYSQPVENLVIVTTDGLRWQEVFGGMDTALANARRYNEGDSAMLYQHYWHADAAVRRQKLMPFVWSTLARQGQIYGNRWLGSRVNNANPYWFSYPGYSELLTGHVDTAINTNNYPPNPHVTLLEFLHQQPGMLGRVAAFGAWEAFDRIINEGRSGIPVASAFDTTANAAPSATQRLVNSMLRDSYKPWGQGECLDVFTHYAAFETLRMQQPRVLYIAYGETDEWAHAGKYRSYLHAAHQVDTWLQQLWQYLQSHPQYRNKTALLFTTDHGRGDKVKSQWTDHGNKVEGANETWFALMAPGLASRGEMKEHEILYQQQLAQTLARIMGLRYQARHRIAHEVPLVFQKP